jgi:hypothetical protein
VSNLTRSVEESTTPAQRRAAGDGHGRINPVSFSLRYHTGSEKAFYVASDEAT